jgi:hypothetical protein
VIRIPRDDQIGLMKIYIDDLEMWIEVAVYSEKNLDTSKIDLEDLSLSEYQRSIVDMWPISPSYVKKKLTTAGVKDVYEAIVREHPSLHPARISKLDPVVQLMSDNDKYEIMHWFRSGGKEGLKPEVFTGTVVMGTPDDAA